jgi:FlaG protein
MASDGQPVQIPATSLVHGSQAPTTVRIRQNGNSLPQSGNAATAAAAEKVQASSATAAAASAAAASAATATPAKASALIRAPDVRAQVAVLNKHLNDSGRPAQFRVDPTSGDTMIQEVNPANGQVVAEYSATEFAALARSVGISGVIVDSRA